MSRLRRSSGSDVSPTPILVYRASSRGQHENASGARARRRRARPARPATPELRVRRCAPPQSPVPRASGDPPPRGRLRTSGMAGEGGSLGGGTAGRCRRPLSIPLAADGSRDGGSSSRSAPRRAAAALRTLLTRCRGLFQAGLVVQHMAAGSAPPHSWLAGSAAPVSAGEAAGLRRPAAVTTRRAAQPARADTGSVALHAAHPPVHIPAIDATFESVAPRTGRRPRHPADRHGPRRSGRRRQARARGATRSARGGSGGGSTSCPRGVCALGAWSASCRCPRSLRRARRARPGRVERHVMCALGARTTAACASSVPYGRSLPTPRDGSRWVLHRDAAAGDRDRRRAVLPRRGRAGVVRPSGSCCSRGQSRRRTSPEPTADAALRLSVPELMPSRDTNGGGCASERPAARRRGPSRSR